MPRNNEISVPRACRCVKRPVVITFLQDEDLPLEETSVPPPVVEPSPVAEKPLTLKPSGGLLLCSTKTGQFPPQVCQEENQGRNPSRRSKGGQARQPTPRSRPSSAPNAAQLCSRVRRRSRWTNRPSQLCRSHEVLLHGLVRRRLLPRAPRPPPSKLLPKVACTPYFKTILPLLLLLLFQVGHPR